MTGFANRSRLCSAASFRAIPAEVGRRARAAEVATLLSWGAWRGLQDKAQLYRFPAADPRAESPRLPHYSKFVEATSRVSRELKALLAQSLAQHRQPQGGSPLVFQDSTALPVCTVAPAGQHRTCKGLAGAARRPAHHPHPQEQEATGDPLPDGLLTGTTSHRARLCVSHLLLRIRSYNTPG
jgi:hypothetical protein